MSAPSQTGIVNAAAALLGSVQRINSLSQSDLPLASHAREVWDSMLREMLADHPWNFAIRRKRLNALAEAPQFGAARAFALPPDCLRWLPPHAADGDAWFEAVEENGRLLSDAAAPLPVRYISDDMLDQVDRWPAFFVTAVEYELAARLAEPMTQSSSLADAMAEKAAMKLRNAKRRDGAASGNMGRVQVISNSSWQQARRGRGHSRGQY